MLRDFKEPFFLMFIEVASQLDFSIDPIQKTRLCFTLFAVLGVNPEVLQSHGDALEIHSLSLRVQAQRHGCAGAQAGQQEFVRRGARICSEWHRLICAPPLIS
jgi:hypothetical protein